MPASSDLSSWPWLVWVSRTDSDISESSSWDRTCSYMSSLICLWSMSLELILRTASLLVGRVLFVFRVTSSLPWNVSTIRASELDSSSILVRLVSIPMRLESILADPSSFSRTMEEWSS